MRHARMFRVTTTIVVLVCFLFVGCAGQMAQSSGELALLCGAGGAVAGAAIGGAASRNWQGAVIGAAVGALAAGLTCFAIGEYKSRQVQDYRQTQQVSGYQPTQGDTVQITQYEITPAAVGPGSSVAFNATYTVMTPSPDADVQVTEVRSLYHFDPNTNQWKELGRVPNHVTVKPGTRQADGKFEVRSGVAQGNYQIVFQVAKGAVTDYKQLPLVVTTNQAVLNSPQARVARADIQGAKPVAVTRPPVPAVATSAPVASPAPVDTGPVAVAPQAAPTVSAAASAPPAAASPQAAASPPAAAPTFASPSAPSADSRPSDTPLSSLGEPRPGAPAAQIAAAAPAGTAGAKRLSYFVASKVSGTGTVRSGPGANHNVAGTIAAGDRHPIVDRAGDSEQTWYKIRLDTGTEVWVAGVLGHEVDE